MSARRLSQGTSRSIASSGSPFADSAANRLSASNNPNCPILASANHAITHEIRTARQQRLFFEMPIDLFADQRPGFYRFGRRGKCQRTVAKSRKEHPNGFSQTEGEPRRWTQHYKKGENNNCNRRQCPMAIQFSRKPIEDCGDRTSN